MTKAFTDDDDLRGATFVAADLSGAVFREADLSGVRMHGVLLVDVELSGLVQGLVVNDVDVGPLIEAELDRRHPERELLRSNEPEGLRRGWAFSRISGRRPRTASGRCPRISATGASTTSGRRPRRCAT
jgi:uncharacterized protein YjbI with pentapeptide repeats